MYLIEQHIHPLASSSHSSTCWPFWLTVKAFSISAAEQLLNQVGWSLCFLAKTYNHQTLLRPVSHFLQIP